MSYERYVQIGLDEVVQLILENQQDEMNALYFETRIGGNAGLTKAVGLQQSFMLDVLYSVKWFRREILNQETRLFEPFKER